MALLHPEQVIGVHLTGIIGAAGGAPPYTAAEQTFIDAIAARSSRSSRTRACRCRSRRRSRMSLNDSPAGLAAWIVEKFRAWSDSNGDVESRFSKDELLTNLMVYWATGTAPASVRMYYEFVREPLKPGRVERPVGMLMSTKDLFPRRRASGANGCSTSRIGSRRTAAATSSSGKSRSSSRATSKRSSRRCADAAAPR